MTKKICILVLIVAMCICSENLSKENPEGREDDGLYSKKDGSDPTVLPWHVSENSPSNLQDEGLSDDIQNEKEGGKRDVTSVSDERTQHSEEMENIPTRKATRPLGEEEKKERMWRDIHGGIELFRRNADRLEGNDARGRRAG
jgi:hypothetical protein